jgi:hypothetical protein
LIAMSRLLQIGLFLLGGIALAALLAEIGFALAATTHGSTPARVIQVQAGAYPLRVSLYKDPADAGFALPFAIAPQQPIAGTLVYDVSSEPGYEVDATPVRATLSADPAVPNGVQGAAEITVQGGWQLHITVDGPTGQGSAYVPIRAEAPPAIPEWLGWLIGLIPLYALLAFVLLQRRRKAAGQPHPA